MNTPQKTGPIARKLIQRFQKNYQQKVVSLQAWRQAQDEFDKLSADITSRISGEPARVAFDLYNFVQNWAMGMMEMMQELPELDKLMTLVEAAQEEYLPGYPPMSPITATFFWPWMLYDLAIGVKRETFASILLSLGREFDMAPMFLDTLSILSESRLGLHMHEGQQGDRILLRELVTGELRSCHAGSGYEGVPGELWLARVLMPPMPGLAHALVFNTPYVVQNANVAHWQLYLERALPQTKKRMRKRPIII